MMTRAALVLSLAFITSATVSAAQTASPYAGQEQHSIKALSEEEIRDLLEGRGMSLAKAAELNSYPGPLHVMQLATQLKLSDAQRNATQSLYATMHDKAQSIGAKIVEAERNLDRAFVGGRIELADLRTRLSAIAALQSELRTVHLEAHIAERSLLTGEQIVGYDVLRGYRDKSTLPDAHRHDH